jgi:hypothetical protein
MPLQHAAVILVPELKTRQRDAMTSDQLWRAARLAGIDPEAASAETAIWSGPVLTGETPPNGSGK